MNNFSLVNVFNTITKDLDKNIKDEKLLLYVKTKMMELLTSCIDTMDNVIELGNKQASIDMMLTKIMHKIERMEEDIYIDMDDDEDDCDCDCGSCDKMHDNDYEFEIVCPYCGEEFIVDEEAQESDEIECPNCQNVIELDWDDSSCNGSCEGCHSHEYEQEESESLDSVAEDEEDYKLEGKSSSKSASNNANTRNVQKVQNSHNAQTKSTQNKSNKNKSSQSKNIRSNNQKSQENKPKNQNEDDM